MVEEDLLKGRNNPFTSVGNDEVRHKFETVASKFGLDWLRETGHHPLKRLWSRDDGLATNQIALIGDALERMATTAETWLSNIVKKIRNGNDNNRIGAAFELLGLSLFFAPDQTVDPAREGQPGFDGTIRFANGHSLQLSLKSYGDSIHGRQVAFWGAKVREALVATLSTLSVKACGLRITAATYPSPSDWKLLLARIPELLREAYAPAQLRTKIGKVWTVEGHQLLVPGQSLSGVKHSHMVFVLVPLHPNENKNLQDKVGEACNNFENHAESKKEASIARAVLIRLGGTASVANCADWSKQYFETYPDSPLSAIILYQPVVSMDRATKLWSISHYVVQVPGPTFAKWASVLRKPIQARVFAGICLSALTQKMVTDGTKYIPADQFYCYQNADIYTEGAKAPDGSITGTMSYLAPGVAIHSVVKINNDHMVVSGKFPPDEDILIFS